MQTGGFWSLQHVSDGKLEGGLRKLLDAGSETEARIVAHLAELDARRLHLLRGRSLFDYCQRKLGFSESEAWYRICAARIGRKFPLVYQMLEKRELNLTAIALIARYLTEANHRELLSEVRGKTKRQILELLVRRWPKADVRSQVRRLPAGAVVAGPTGTLEPLSVDGYCLQLKISQSVNEKLELACALMSHSNARGDLAVVIERGLDLLLESLKARRFGQPKRSVRRGTASPGVVLSAELKQELAEPVGARKLDTPATDPEADGRDAERVAARLGREEMDAGGPSREKIEAERLSQEKIEAGANGGERHGAPQIGGQRQGRAVMSRQRQHIPQAVRRQVVERDGECCSFICADGSRCSTRAFLQLHHVHAFAIGGADSAENLRLFCRAHNLLVAHQELGTEVIAHAMARRSRASTGRGE